MSSFEVNDTQYGHPAQKVPALNLALTKAFSLPPSTGVIGKWDCYGVARRAVFASGKQVLEVFLTVSET